MNIKYYFPLKSECLAHYFGSACIKPSRYFLTKPSDIQNRFSDFLLLTKSMGTRETDCCLEIVLTSSEANELINLNGLFLLLNKPLPISRVKSIIFSSHLQKEHTITNIEMSTAFIPKKIIQVTANFDYVDASKLEKPPGLRNNDWDVGLRKFNSLLGAFALLRLCGNDWVQYFSTLANFNSKIEDTFSRYHPSGNLCKHELFKKILPFLDKTIEDSDLEEMARKENQQIIRNYLKIIDLNALSDATYIVAVLKNFGVGEESKKKKVDGLILSRFKSELKKDNSELIALCYGWNRGYSVFNNKYVYLGQEVKVKFELNSPIDFFTIDILFNHSFEDPQIETFPCLDNDSINKAILVDRKIS